MSRSSRSPGCRNLAKAGSLIELSKETLDTAKKNFSEDWIKLGSVDGKAYGVWFKGSNKSTVWYNTAVYDNAGATQPKTWDDFVSQLKAVSDSGVAGLSVGADVGWPLSDWFENVYLRTAGPEKYDQLTKHEDPVDRSDGRRGVDGAVEAVERQNGAAIRWRATHVRRFGNTGVRRSSEGRDRV